MKAGYYKGAFYTRGFCDLVELQGFSGYFVDRFNDIVSTQSFDGKVLSVSVCKNGVYTLERVTLFDDDGKRCCRSKRKVLVDTLGKSEFERRESNRVNREDILAKEAEERAIRDKAKEYDDLVMMAEIHFDTPTHLLDPEVAKVVEQKKALGDLF